jgi:hypothetical protein
MSFMQGELDRVVKYARGLGLTVTFKPYKKGSGVGGEYDGETKEVIVYRQPRESLTNLILILIHEVSHHLDFVYKGKRDPVKLVTALEKEFDRKPGDPPIAYTYREYIYECESAAADFMPQVARELDLKMPIWKVEAEAELDRWVAKHYMTTGEYPMIKLVVEKRRDLRARFKEKHG